MLYRSWIHGNINQFCPKCKAPIKIESQKSSFDDEYRDDNIENGEKKEEEQKKEDSVEATVETMIREREHKEIIRTLNEIEILESITSYDNILKKKDALFKENFSYEDILNLEKQIKENVFNFDSKNNISANYSKSNKTKKINLIKYI